MSTIAMDHEWKGGWMVLMIKATADLDMFDPQRWGLPNEAVANLANRLCRFWLRFRHCFKTQTCDSSEYAWFYVRGLLTMETKRNFANIARRVIDPDDDGQNLQQFTCARYRHVRFAMARSMGFATGATGDYCHTWLENRWGADPG